MCQNKCSFEILSFDIFIGFFYNFNSFKGNLNLGKLQKCCMKINHLPINKRQSNMKPVEVNQYCNLNKNLMNMKSL